MMQDPYTDNVDLKVGLLIELARASQGLAVRAYEYVRIRIMDILLTFCSDRIGDFRA